MEFTKLVYYLNTKMNIYFQIISLGIMLLIIYNGKIKNRFIRLLCINNKKIKRISEIVFGVTSIFTLIVISLFYDNSEHINDLSRVSVKSAHVIIVSICVTLEYLICYLVDKSLSILKLIKL